MYTYPKLLQEEAERIIRWGNDDKQPGRGEEQDEDTNRMFIETSLGTLNWTTVTDLPKNEIETYENFSEYIMTKFAEIKYRWDNILTTDVTNVPQGEKFVVLGKLQEPNNITGQINNILTSGNPDIIESITVLSQITMHLTHFLNKIDEVLGKDRKALTYTHSIDELTKLQTEMQAKTEELEKATDAHKIELLQEIAKLTLKHQVTVTECETNRRIQENILWNNIKMIFSLTTQYIIGFQNMYYKTIHDFNSDYNITGSRIESRVRSERNRLSRFKNDNAEEIEEINDTLDKLEKDITEIYRRHESLRRKINLKGTGDSMEEDDNYWTQEQKAERDNILSIPVISVGRDNGDQTILILPKPPNQCPYRT